MLALRPEVHVHQTTTGALVYYRHSTCDSRVSVIRTTGLWCAVRCKLCAASVILAPGPLVYAWRLAMPSLFGMSSNAAYCIGGILLLSPTVAATSVGASGEAGATHPRLVGDAFFNVRPLIHVLTSGSVWVIGYRHEECPGGTVDVRYSIGCGYSISCRGCARGYELSLGTLAYGWHHALPLLLEKRSSAPYQVGPVQVQPPRFEIFEPTVQRGAEATLSHPPLALGGRRRAGRAALRAASQRWGCLASVYG